MVSSDGDSSQVVGDAPGPGAYAGDRGEAYLSGLVQVELPVPVVSEHLSPCRAAVAVPRVRIRSEAKVRPSPVSGDLAGEFLGAPKISEFENSSYDLRIDDNDHTMMRTETREKSLPSGGTQSDVRPTCHCGASGGSETPNVRRRSVHDSGCGHGDPFLRHTIVQDLHNDFMRAGVCARDRSILLAIIMPLLPEPKTQTREESNAP